MASRLQLYFDWFNQKAIKGPTNPGEFVLPTFYQGSVVAMEVRIYKPSVTGGPTDFNQESVSGKSLKLAVSAQPLGDVGGETPFVTQFSWSSDTSSSDEYWYADVAFNTAALNTEMGTSHSIERYMQLEFVEGSAINPIWQGKITIKAKVIEETTATVAAGETPLSLEVADQKYVQYQLPAGKTIVLVSADGTKARRIGVNNDGSGMDDYIDLS